MSAATAAVLGALVTAAAALVRDWWLKRRVDAEAHKVIADAELVTAQTLTVVIDGVRAELDRVSKRVKVLEDQLATEKRARTESEEREQRTRMELERTTHRFQVLVDHHGNVVEVATDAGVTLPPPPALLIDYLTAAAHPEPS